MTCCTATEMTVNGRRVSNIRVVQSYKGNYHLLADIDGTERKYVIGRNKETFAIIERTGIANLTAEQLRTMAETYLKLND